MTFMRPRRPNPTGTSGGGGIVIAAAAAAFFVTRRAHAFTSWRSDGARCALFVGGGFRGNTLVLPLPAVLLRGLSHSGRARSLLSASSASATFSPRPPSSSSSPIRTFLRNQTDLGSVLPTQLPPPPLVFQQSNTRRTAVGSGRVNPVGLSGMTAAPFNIAAAFWPLARLKAASTTAALSSGAIDVRGGRLHSASYSTRVAPPPSPPPPPRNSPSLKRGHSIFRRAFRFLGFSLIFVVAAALTAAVVVIIYLTPTAMPPHEMVGHALNVLLRSALTMIAATAIALEYSILFSQWSEYSSDEYKAARNVVHKRAAEWLLWLARIQKGIYIKYMQHIASMTYVAPEPYTSTLSVLQDKAPFRPFSVVTKVVTDELGIASVSERFSDFEETPIAAASLAQVHRATTTDGQLVAVKVQYPDVARLLVLDTATMQLLSDIAGYLFPDFSFSWVVTEFRQTLLAELDFTREGRNCDASNARFAHRRNSVRCPGVRWDLTSERVLTMEFVDGVKVNHVEGLKALGVNPRDVGTLVCDAFAEMIFCHGVVHCDPHAGNMLVVKSPADPTKPQLVLLDHGMYRSLDNKFRVLYCKLWKAMVMNDSQLLSEVSTELGAGGQESLFPVMFTGRTMDSSTRLGAEMTHAERARLHASMRSFSANDFVSFLESLPRDMLFAVRIGNLVQGIHRELGGANVERFWLNAAYAVKGTWCVGTDERERTVAEAVRAAHLSELGGNDDGGRIGRQQMSARWSARGLTVRTPLSLMDGLHGWAAQIGFLRDMAWLGVKRWALDRMIEVFFVVITVRDWVYADAAAAAVDEDERGPFGPLPTYSV
ncbi:ABC1 family-domain-containing protein [Zopfochytrium polystomum]|nr:ABC1 family-domain-containing protein [Zopfochytrium polystomum]